MPPTTPRQGLLAAGNFIVDHVKLIDAWPSQDALVSILSEESANGGGPYNLTKNLSRLFRDPEAAAFPLAAAGLVGDDADGRWILDDCAAHGIDTTHLRLSENAPTSYTDVMTVASTGRRTFFHQRGANALFDENGVDFAGVTARIFYLGYLLLLDALDAKRPDGQTGATILLRRATAAGLTTVLDLVSEESGRFREVLAPALPEADVLLTNEFEASRLSGVDLESFTPETARAAAAAILELGVRRLVVIHAPAGAVALERGGSTHTSGSVRVPEEEIKGALGAGDAFAAGFLHGFHESKTLGDCLRLGACVAASCLRHPTPSGGIPPLRECVALGERWGFRDF
ncbi:MAG: carbohydrate kinase family protein [Verrucomicrobiae bacterium]|nr:carbohydrate kinase family protein [Verrucomicrobiae bacterium]MCP5538518.1 carbohydrate kinase family protein [Akkermansiaceae bacterium]